MFDAEALRLVEELVKKNPEGYVNPVKFFPLSQLLEREENSSFLRGSIDGLENIKTDISFDGLIEIFGLDYRRIVPVFDEKTDEVTARSVDMRRESSKLRLTSDSYVAEVFKWPEYDMIRKLEPHLNMRPADGVVRVGSHNYNVAMDKLSLRPLYEKAVEGNHSFIMKVKGGIFGGGPTYVLHGINNLNEKQNK